LSELNKIVFDELEEDEPLAEPLDEITISLSYPHWRAGTLPLNNRLKALFPTAYETPRVKFDFRDGNNNEKFSGWVVRPNKYVYGLREWYENRASYLVVTITIQRSKDPGEIVVKTHKSKKFARLD